MAEKIDIELSGGLPDVEDDFSKGYDSPEMDAAIRFRDRLEAQRAARAKSRSWGSFWLRLHETLVLGLLFAILYALLVGLYRLDALSAKPLPAPVSIPKEMGLTERALAQVGEMAQPAFDPRIEYVISLLDDLKAEQARASRHSVHHSAHDPVKTHARQGHKRKRNAHRRKANKYIYVPSAPFRPEIDKSCPEGYELRQPGICYSSKTKALIIL